MHSTAENSAKQSIQKDTQDAKSLKPSVPKLTPDQIAFEQIVDNFKGDEKLIIVWKNVVFWSAFHLACLYAFLVVFPGVSKNEPAILALLTVMHLIFSLGVTAGVHRLWSHRSYKAHPLLQFFLLVVFSGQGQHSVFHWARDHRLHHKKSDTNADPHNINRGFFFSHIGWLMVKKNRATLEEMKKIDISDLKKSFMLRMQHKYYLLWFLSCAIILPIVISHNLCGFSLSSSIWVCVVLRLFFAYHSTWAINSCNHSFGWQPFDRFIPPRKNIFTALLASGEGYHNFHHTFPNDYSTSEYGAMVNFTKFFIDLAAKFGLVSNRIRMSQETIAQRAQRTGDGTFAHHHHH